MRLELAGAVVGVLVISAFALGTQGTLVATPPSPPPAQPPPPADGFTSGENVGAVASDGDESDGDDEPRSPETGVVSTPQPTCGWFDVTFARNDYFETGGVEYRYIDLHFFRYRPATGEAWVRMQYRCTYPDGRTTSELRWYRTNDPDPELLAESAFDRIERERMVKPPVPSLSPTTEGVVNLGMWLAVAEPEQDPVSVRADAGNVWAVTSAVLRETTFDMGDGTPPIDGCGRIGDPIPPGDLDTLDESPVCGHTYRSTNDGESFQITITSYWDVSWTSNVGAGGDLGTMERQVTIPYVVREIQTVGGAGGD